jgi:hypothetical protein
MRFLIFVPPKEFRDESVSLVKLFFDKWGIDYSVSSYTSSDCVGSHGAVYKPDINTSRVSSEDYNGIVLIDGNGIDLYKLYDYRPLLDLLLRFNNAKKFIVGIDNAVKIPARANIVKDRPVATDDKETIRLVKLFHGVPSANVLELSGNLITIKKASDVEDSMPKVLEHIGVA